MSDLRRTTGTGFLEVVEEGGRIARLVPCPEGPNVLWRGDAVAPLTGGDRLWLAPERDLLYEGDPSVRDNWRCPEELDPGSWEAVVDDEAIVLRQHALGTGMQRTVRALRTPPVETHLPWAGYRIHDEVETDLPRSGWHLTMVASPAELYVHRSGEAMEYYGSAPPVEGGWVDAVGTEEWKLGFRPPADGRVVLAALSPEDPGPLVVVATSAEPDGTYVDVPPSGSGPATAVQIYDSPGLGFAELEHHFPLEDRAATATVLGVVGSRTDRLAVLEQISEIDPYDLQEGL